MRKRVIGIIMLINVILLLFIGVGVILKQTKQYDWGVPTQKEYGTTLRVVADVDYKPFSFIDQNGNPAGYDVELIYAIGEYLQSNIELYLEEWPDAVVGLESGEYDLLLGMTYSAKNLDKICYSVPLLEECYTVFGRNMEDVTLTNLSDKAIALLENDNMEEIVIAPYGLSDRVIRFATYTECFEALLNGQCGYVIAPSVTGELILREMGVYDIETYHTFVYNSIYCAGVLKQNAEMMQPINEAIMVLCKDGTLDEIYERWVVQYKGNTSLLSILEEYKTTVVIILLLVLIVFSLILFLYENARSRQLLVEVEKERKINSLNLQLDTVLWGISGGFNIRREDKKFSFMYMSEAAAALFGYTVDECMEVTGGNLSDMVYEGDLTEEQYKNLRSLKQDEPFSLKYRVRCKDGTIKWIMDHGKRVINEEGEKLFYSFFQDVTELEESRLRLKETAAMLRQERQQYREALLCECLYAFSFDVTSGLLTEEYTNGSESVLKRLGLSVPVHYDEVMAAWKQMTNPQSLYKACPTQEVSYFVEAFEQGRRSLEFEYYLPESDTYERQTLFLFKNEENHHIVACSIAKDITELRKKEEQTKRALTQLTRAAEKIAQGDLEVEIECCGEGEVKILAESMSKTTAELRKRIAYINELAYLDLLTGLANKTAYAKRIEALELELSLNPDMQFGMAMLDINNLKMVNDSMGHEMGDLFIKEATGMMKAVFEGCIIYRVGGDEFAVLFFPPLLEQMETLVARFEKHMTEYNHTHHEFPCGVWVAVGYSTYDSTKDSKYVDVFKRADELMYWNKSQKKAFANQQI